jgi:hypothetical protein
MKSVTSSLALLALVLMTVREVVTTIDRVGTDLEEEREQELV